jgi:hypothetical protein
MSSPVQDVVLRTVERDYRHAPKEVTPGALLELSGAWLKWYNLAPAAEAVPEHIEQRARRFLVAQAGSGGLELDRELGFVILHRCGKAFYFLIVSTWRGSNELWETIFYKENEAMEEFAPYTFKGAHRGTFCVWELGAVVHEKDAWVRFLTSERSGLDKESYLEATFRGTV